MQSQVMLPTTFIDYLESKKPLMIPYKSQTEILVLAFLKEENNLSESSLTCFCLRGERFKSFLSSL